MRKSTLFIIMMLVAQSLSAQIRTEKLTVYKQFKPSTIMLKDGRELKQPLTNIFLKNSSLLYMNGTNSMEANMDNIISVKFDDRQYIKIDTMLYYLVDTIGNDVTIGLASPCVAICRLETTQFHYMTVPLFFWLCIVNGT